MKTVSDWYASLPQEKRKDLVSLMFDVRRKLAGNAQMPLFEEFLQQLDQEYHSLK